MKVKDHLGNEFRSKSQMCGHYGISTGAFDARIRRGWTLKDALESSLNEGVSSTDHLGNTFPSVRGMCRHWNVNIYVYYNRVKDGWSLKDALETPLGSTRGKRVQDHLGNTFNSQVEMLKHYGLSQQTFGARRRAGWSLKDILETPVGQGNSKGRWLFGHK